MVECDTCKNVCGEHGVMELNVKNIKDDIFSIKTDMRTLKEDVSKIVTAVELLKQKNSIFYGFLGAIPALAASAVACWKVFTK